jgi:spermidine synthase
MVVVEALECVIDWHRSGLVPLGLELAADHRCRFVQGDFFALAKSAEGFDADVPSRKFDAVLVDIDHTPDAVLDPSNAEFYTEAGLARVVHHLRPRGIFGLWSNDPPDDQFTARLGHVFADARGVPICFHNPLQDNMAMQTVYLARVPPEAATGVGG